MSQPLKWDTGTNRASLVAHGEGDPVKVKGFLLRATQLHGAAASHAFLPIHSQRTLFLLFAELHP
jgi:hypothetical protein